MSYFPTWSFYKVARDLQIIWKESRKTTNPLHRFSSITARLMDTERAVINLGLITLLGKVTFDMTYCACLTLCSREISLLSMGNLVPWEKPY